MLRRRRTGQRRNRSERGQRDRAPADAGRLQLLPALALAQSQCECSGPSPSSGDAHSSVCRGCRSLIVPLTTTLTDSEDHVKTRYIVLVAAVSVVASMAVLFGLMSPDAAKSGSAQAAATAPDAALVRMSTPRRPAIPPRKFTSSSSSIRLRDVQGLLSARQEDDGRQSRQDSPFRSPRGLSQRLRLHRQDARGREEAGKVLGGSRGSLCVPVDVGDPAHCQTGSGVAEACLPRAGPRSLEGRHGIAGGGEVHGHRRARCEGTESRQDPGRSSSTARPWRPSATSSCSGSCPMPWRRRTGDAHPPRRQRPKLAPFR